MSNTSPSHESNEDQEGLDRMEGKESADAVLAANTTEIFEQEKESYKRFGEWAEKEIKELEEDILEECRDQPAN